MPRADHKRLELAKAISAAISHAGRCLGGFEFQELTSISGSSCCPALRWWTSSAQKYQLTSGGKSERIITSRSRQLWHGQAHHKTTNPGIVPVDVYFLELPK